MVGTLVLETPSGDIQSLEIPGDSMEAIDTDSRKIIDLLNGSFLSLTF